MMNTKNNAKLGKETISGLKKYLESAIPELPKEEAELVEKLLKKFRSDRKSVSRDDFMNMCNEVRIKLGTPIDVMDLVTVEDVEEPNPDISEVFQEILTNVEEEKKNKKKKKKVVEHSQEVLEAIDKIFDEPKEEKPKKKLKKKAVKKAAEVEEPKVEEPKKQEKKKEEPKKQEKKKLKFVIPQKANNEMEIQLAEEFLEEFEVEKLGKIKVIKGLLSLTDLETMTYDENRTFYIVVYWTSRQMSQFNYSELVPHFKKKSLPNDVDVVAITHVSSHIMTGISIYSERPTTITPKDMQYFDEGFRFTNGAEFQIYELIEPCKAPCKE